jgi:hypothetical protein
MDIEIPVGSWSRRGTIAVIDDALGERLWAAARAAHDGRAAFIKAAGGLDKQIKAIIGDGYSLTLEDGRVLALLEKSTRRGLDRAAMAAAGIDLEQYQTQHDVLTLALAPELGPPPERKRKRAK